MENQKQNSKQNSNQNLKTNNIGFKNLYINPDSWKKIIELDKKLDLVNIEDYY